MKHRATPVWAMFLVSAALFADGLSAEEDGGAPEKGDAPKIGQTFNFKTENGREMKHTILRRIEPDGLTFETKTGLEKLTVSALPPELAIHFKHDAREVRRYVEKQRALQKALAAKQAAEAAKHAGQTKAVATPPLRPAAPAEAPLGVRGQKSLGSPRLGGRGGEK